MSWCIICPQVCSQILLAVTDSISWWGKWRECEVLHIELLRLHQPANHSESEARWEQPGYKYNVTTAALVCAAERQKACWEETEERREEGRVKRKETLSKKDRGRKKKSTKVRSSARVCLTSVSRCKNHLRSHNLKPEMSLVFTHCQSSPASVKHTRQIRWLTGNQQIPT